MNHEPCQVTSESCNSAYVVMQQIAPLKTDVSRRVNSSNLRQNNNFHQYATSPSMTKSHFHTKHVRSLNQVLNKLWYPLPCHPFHIPLLMAHTLLTSLVLNGNLHLSRLLDSNQTVHPSIYSTPIYLPVPSVVNTNTHPPPFSHKGPPHAMFHPRFKM